MRRISIMLVLGLTVSTIAGCSSKSTDVAYVESVGMICGIGPVGLTDTFAGVVTPQSETEIKKSEEEAVAELLVSVGDEVTADQVLFTYDTEQITLNLEKAKLELEQMKNTVTVKEKEKAVLEKEKKQVSSDQQLQYTLEIQEADAQILETQYNISAKEKEIEKMNETLNSLEVKSPINGVVQSINENGETDDYGNLRPYITIVETGAYKVKGYVNESNAQAVSEGTQVMVHSRVDDTVWNGTVSMIDWQNPVQQENNYYSEQDTASSSKYAFYVELENDENLMMGQHVYLEMQYGDNAEEATGIQLPSYYLNDIESEPWIWAQGKNGKLEKRDVILGEYLEDIDTYVIEDGLEITDYISFPDDTLKEGMECSTYDEAIFSEGGESVEDGGRPDASEIIEDDMMEEDITVMDEAGVAE